MLPTGDNWDETEGDLPLYYPDNLTAFPVHWQGYPNQLPSIFGETAQAGVMFWVCESDRVHQSWVATLALNRARLVPTPVVVIGGLGSYPPVAGCGCQGRPGAGWRRGLPGKVPLEGPTGEDGPIVGLGLEGNLY